MFSKNKKQKSDYELINDFQKRGDLSSFEVLFQRYSHLVFCVCYDFFRNNEESEDSVMEIFEKAMNVMKNYEISNFKNWLYSLTRNYCISKLKKWELQENSKKIFLSKQKNFMENSDFESLLIWEAFQKKELDICLNRLKEDQRVCIEMFYFENKTYKQISEETGIELKKVKSHIQNGKRKLKNDLEKSGVFKDV